MGRIGIMRATPFLAAAFTVVFVLPALAQTAPATTPVRIRGTVEKLDGHNLTVKSRDGHPVTIVLAPDFGVLGVEKKGLGDIKAGDYVASTSLKGADGKLKAIEVHIFLENMRGLAEGQFPWDLAPDSIMTNATIAEVAAAPEGRVMKVKFKGNESEITVPDGIPIVGYVPADASLLKPGAAVFIFAQKKPDGSLTAGRVTAEKDGVKPPM
jgi:hypothetical protein